MNEIAERVENYYDEIPTELKTDDTFGRSIQSNEQVSNKTCIDKRTEELRDSTLYSSYRDRRSSSSPYNYSLLNDLNKKVES